MKTQSKTSYVLKQPAMTPAKEVVKRAKADGIKLSVAQVYNIRSNERRRFQALAVVDPAKPVSPQTKALRETLEMQGHYEVAQYTADEAALRASALNIGLLRARALLDEMGAQ